MQDVQEAVFSAVVDGLGLCERDVQMLAARPDGHRQIADAIKRRLAMPACACNQTRREAPARV